MYDITGNYLPLISFFSISKRPTDPTKEVKWPVKRSITLKWPKCAPKWPPVWFSRDCDVTCNRSIESTDSMIIRASIILFVDLNHEIEHFIPGIAGNYSGLL